MNSCFNHRMMSLFTGAGGLDLGLEAAGFRPALCVEVDEDARRTLAANRLGWMLSDPGNIHALRPEELLEQASLKPRQITLLIAGPPCQPFSKSAYWTNGDARRLADPRSHTLQAFIDAVRTILPQALILENVQGLAYRGKDEGLRLLIGGLKSINKTYRTSYQPQVISLNVANYGVPQIRHRVFVIASIDGAEMVMPAPTHGCEKGLAYRGKDEGLRLLIGGLKSINKTYRTRTDRGTGPILHRPITAVKNRQPWLTFMLSQALSVHHGPAPVRRIAPSRSPSSTPSPRWFATPTEWVSLPNRRFREHKLAKCDWFQIGYSLPAFRRRSLR